MGDLRVWPQPFRSSGDMQRGPCKPRIECGLFFFPGRRRHTRYIGDWSSDVCSSDLETCSPTLPAVWWRDRGGMLRHAMLKRGFDLLAPHYRWMERILAGSQLQKCRTKYLPAIADAKRILLLGEGPGRFLCEVLRSCPLAEITCLDSSAKMLAQARDTTNRNVTFVHADVFEYDFPREHYDAVATHFFLDCFRPEQLEVVLPRIAPSLISGGAWVLSDFRLPSQGLSRWRAAMVLKTMYLFFRAATALPARRLTDPTPYLEQNSLALVERHIANW